MQIDKLFWRNKTVLVTGHTGFKGSWLTLWLTAMGAKVIGFSLEPPTQPNLFQLSQLETNITNIIGDVCNLSSLQKIFIEYQPEIVFHLAAQSLVRASYDNPVQTYATNVMGTVHVLEAVRQTNSVKASIIVTSDKCYENKEWCWGYRENERMGGFDPYSNSKGCAELVTSAYIKSFFNTRHSERTNSGIASVRAGNVIGGGDFAEDRLIPDIFKALLNQQTITLRNPQAIRPWQHVLEPLNAYLGLAEKLYQQGNQYSGPWNFGPDDEDHTVLNIADKIITLWGQGKIKLDNNPNAVHEAHYLKLDCSKAKSLLKWRPKLDLDESLALTVDWFNTYKDAPSTMRLFTLQQIENYSKC